jgi:hypothetical protein
MHRMKKTKKTWFSLLQFLLVCALVLGLGFSVRAPVPAKIYDCFLFFNELELLEIRLNELSEHVDYFVIVEATETFRGKEKPLIFEQNKHRFEKFADQIIYVPIQSTLNTSDPWTREHYQRGQLVRGLKHCNPYDLIFISDLDEIIRGDKVEEISRLILSRKTEGAVCIQDMYYGFLNRLQSNWWPGPVCLKYEDVKRLSMKQIRNLRDRKAKTLKKAGIHTLATIENAGWHFTSMGGIQRQVTKLESFSHSELEHHKFHMEDYVKAILETLPRVEVDKNFPQYLQDHKTHFEEIGFIDTRN